MPLAPTPKIEVTSKNHVRTCTAEACLSPVILTRSVVDQDSARYCCRIFVYSQTARPENVQFFGCILMKGSPRRSKTEVGKRRRPIIFHTFTDRLRLTRLVLAVGRGDDRTSVSNRLSRVPDYKLFKSHAVLLFAYSYSAVFLYGQNKSQSREDAEVFRNRSAEGCTRNGPNTLCWHIVEGSLQVHVTSHHPTPS